jgi:hypothetical protein
MSICVHHWRQEAGALHSPFVCKHCGESKGMETDFYKLYEKPFDRNEDALEEQALIAA